MIWFIAGMFTFVAIPISLWGILQHVVYFTRPDLQLYIIRILWMVPIYGINSWMALYFPSSSIYLDTIREVYQAYVIYNFMFYLLKFLNKEYDMAEQMENKVQIKHTAPLCCLKSWSNESIIRRCKHGVLNYTALRPVTTIIALICELTGTYNEGSFSFQGAWSYLLIINNLSQVWALYCMILFYHATKEELEPIKPLSKFLCVKLTIFASFWQALFVNILVETGALQPKDAWNMDKYAFGKAIQDFLVCIEMFLAAIAHYYSFSYKPYKNDGPRSRFFSNFKKMWDMSDVKKDIAEHVTVVGNDWKRKVGNMGKIYHKAFSNSL
ncbi:transmembrane protein 184C-like [Antedon mediterranea]|uniref:transmembrane protein 184C-like n=1 Tax=Antedon mediterranea TaxID=105859 RepID=UPI003AF61EBD